MTTEIMERIWQNSAAHDRQSLPATRTKTGALVPLHQTTPVREVGIGFVIWLVELPRQYTLQDAMEPALWRQIELLLRQRGPRRPKVNDLVRIIRHNGFDPDANFDALFRVDAVEEGVGYRLSYYAGRLPAEGSPS